MGDKISGKLIDTLDTSFESLYDIILAPIKSKLLLVALELKVFDHLTDYKSANEMAKILGSNPRNTELFLDGLGAFDIVNKNDNKYCNSSSSQTFLVQNSPYFIGQLLTEQWQMSEPVLQDLKTFIIQGPQEIESITMGDESGKALANYERSGISQLVSRIVKELPEHPHMKKMLDLGGGPGIIGMSIVANHPSMKGAIFELPNMAKVAEKYVQEYDMEERMEVLVGDYNCDPIGQEYDLVLACATLYSSRPDIDSIVRKIYQSLNPGGVFLSIHEGLTQEKTKPEIMRLGWLAAELLGKDLAFAQGEIAESMIKMGFKSVRSYSLNTPIGPMDIDLGRKA